MTSNAFPHAATIEASLALMAERAGDPTSLVYARLFAARPDLRELFCNDRSGAVRGEMLARVFDAILDFVNDRQYADHFIHSERMAHDSYGVPPDIFATFFGAVADTLRDVLGEDWTSETEAAWAELLDAIAAS
jgi:hemoglobin-like flavoprotein